MEEENTQTSQRKTIYTWGGAFIGLFIVKAFIFNPMETMGWHLFWDILFAGQISFQGLLEVVTTSGFIKLAIGTGLGYKIGEMVEDGTLQGLMNDNNEKETEDKKGE